MKSEIIKKEHLEIDWKIPTQLVQSRNDKLVVLVTKSSQSSYTFEGVVVKEAYPFKIGTYIEKWNAQAFV